MMSSSAAAVESKTNLRRELCSASYCGKCAPYCGPCCNRLLKEQEEEEARALKEQEEAQAAIEGRELCSASYCGKCGPYCGPCCNRFLKEEQGAAQAATP